MSTTRPSPPIEQTSHQRGALTRRATIAAAGLTLPAIALTIATPASAASTLDLHFGNTVYWSGQSDTVSNVRVYCQAGNNPRAGVVVTVSLASGLQFVTGGTTYAGVTGSDGTILTPDVKILNASGGNASATASGAATAWAVFQLGSGFHAFM